MGSALSRVRTMIQTIYGIYIEFDTLEKRAQLTPGIPKANPTHSAWMHPSAQLNGSNELPVHTDLTIIGSGITGTSIARTLLASRGEVPLHIVMLEARDVCSGATGRNGGHITPPLYHDYTLLKNKHGHAVAQKMMRFRRAHLEELLTVAKLEDIVEESECRRVETVDVYFDEAQWQAAKVKIATYLEELPVNAGGVQAWESREAIEKFGLSETVKGCFSSEAGAINPYRFVTAILSRLVREHTNFQLFENTPCSEILEPTSTKPYYTIITPSSGTFTSTQIIHATNGWSSHLLSPMRDKIIPARGTMSAQQPSPSMAMTMPAVTPSRSFVFYPGKEGFDYLTVRPDSTGGELMFGGALMSTGLSEIANTDDTKWAVPTASVLAGALPVYFGLYEERWKQQTPPVVKSMWSGILGMSVDGLPWVGRLPTKVSGRGGRGEWIASGYSGEGMVHAWLCGRALAFVVLGKEGEGALESGEGEVGLERWFPDVMTVTEERWKKVGLNDLADAL